MKKQISIPLIINIALFSFVFLYLTFRSNLVPFVHDEAATFFHYIQKGVFLPPNAHWDANNHILNSALATLSSHLFGTSEFALRLPNLLIFPLFFFFTYKISTQLSNKALRWTFFITLIFSHHFIEYFALSRGYGMSMAFLLASVWYVMKVFENQKLKYYFWASVFLSLAMLSNLTLANSAIIIIGILFIQLIRNYKTSGPLQSLNTAIVILMTSGLTLAFSVWYLFEFKAKGLLYYGTLDGFWDLSVNSFIKMIIGQENTIVGIFIIFYFLLSIGVFVYYFFKQKSLEKMWKSHFLFFYLLIGNLVAVSILGYFMNVNFPEDRTGLYFYPFFIGSIFFLLDTISFEKRNNLVLLVIIPFLFFPLHFFYNFNFTHSSFWKSERIPHQFHQKILADYKSSNDLPTIGGYHIRALCWAFENHQQGGELNYLQTTNYPETFSDFQIVDARENPDWALYYQEIDRDANSGLSLLKRNEKINDTMIHQILESERMELNKAFKNIYKFNVNSLVGETILLEVKMGLESERVPFNSKLVVQVNDKDSKMVMYENIPFSWIKTQWTADEYFHGKVYLKDIPLGAEKMVVYIWNIDKETFVINNIAVSIKMLKPRMK